MLLTAETTDDGEARVYFTQQASVVSYFTDDTEGGTQVHVTPGEFACPWSTTEAKLAAVGQAMLAETARRLNCRPEAVVSHSLSQIAAVADPLLKHRNTWTGRSRSLRRPSR